MKLDNDNYLALTTRTNVDRSNKGFKLVDGFFFLQQSGKSRYLARFKVEAQNVSHYKDEEGDNIDLNDEEINKNGSNLSAIELTDIKIQAGHQVPDVPELKAFQNTEFAEETKFVLSGYPEEVIEKVTGTKGKDLKVETKKVSDMMYSCEGPCTVKGPEVLEADLLASAGQEGGAITFKDSGHVFGIYTGCFDSETEDSKMSFCVRMNNAVVNWIDGL